MTGSLTIKEMMARTRAIYPEEKERKYGALGIRIKCLGG